MARMRFVEVAVPIPVRKLFTYRVPDTLEGEYGRVVEEIGRKIG